jgi:hypothetical protein
MVQESAADGPVKYDRERLRKLGRPREPCEVCGGIDHPRVRDRCHAHGWIRGVLCNYCNGLMMAIDRGATRHQGQVVTHCPVLGEPAVGEAEDVHRVRGHLSAGDGLAGQEGEGVADVAAADGDPDHDSVVFAHDGVDVQPHVGEGALDPLTDGAVDVAASLAADVIVVVGGEDFVDDRVVAGAQVFHELVGQLGGDGICHESLRMLVVDRQAQGWQRLSTMCAGGRSAARDPASIVRAGEDGPGPRDAGAGFEGV